jgi:CBS domain-containing protein
MYARDMMSKDVATIAAAATAFEAAERLVEARVSALVVLDGDGAMVGIVSEADLIRGAAAAAKAVGLDVLGRIEDDERSAAAVAAIKTRRVADVMTRGVIAAHETATLREISDLMLKHRIKRVPIVRDRHILGVVGRADLLRALIAFGPKAYTG